MGRGVGRSCQNGTRLIQNRPTRTHPGARRERGRERAAPKNPREDEPPGGLSRRTGPCGLPRQKSYFFSSVFSVFSVVSVFLVFLAFFSFLGASAAGASSAA